MKKQLLVLIKSTAVVLFVSTLISLSVWMFKGNFIAAFLLAVAFQYVLFSFVGGIINNYLVQQTRQKELDKLEQLSSILECASCKKPNVITFIPDEKERVEFVCESCAKKNVVNIVFSVAGVTEPIIMNNTNIPAATISNG